MTRSALTHKDRFKIFTRTWWKENASFPNGLEPDVGTAHIVGYAATEREARQMCAEWNATHKPGRYGRRAEFTESR